MKPINKSTFLQTPDLVVGSFEAPQHQSAQVLPEGLRKPREASDEDQGEPHEQGKTRLVSSGSIQSVVLSSVDPRVGEWTTEEHEKFIEAINLYGNKWKSVERRVGTRSRTQIRSHAQKYFKTMKNQQVRSMQARKGLRPNLFLVIRAQRDMTNIVQRHPHELLVEPVPVPANCPTIHRRAVRKVKRTRQPIKRLGAFQRAASDSNLATGATYETEMPNPQPISSLEFTLIPEWDRGWEKTNPLFECEDHWLDSSQKGEEERRMEMSLGEREEPEDPDQKGFLSSVRYLKD